MLTHVNLLVSDIQNIQNTKWLKVEYPSLIAFKTRTKYHSDKIHACSKK